MQFGAVTLRELLVPDGIPFLFYQKFWDLVKDDIVRMFNDFHTGTLDLYRCPPNPHSQKDRS
jgi:hypothetical protein